jgi:hypothetical protein
MKKVHIRESLKNGWALFMKRPWYLLGLALAVTVLFGVSSTNNIMASALSYILYGGYLSVLLKHYANEPIVFDDIFSLDGRWVSFAFLGLIKTVLIMFGFMCFIIPGVYLIVRWMFAELYVIDKGMRPLEALKASSVLTAGYKWKLTLFLLVAASLSVFGLLFLIIGAVVAFVVVEFAAIDIYKNLQKETPQE